jgi:hypothetical protein
MYRLLVGNPQGKRPIRKQRRRLVDNIKWILERQDREGVLTGSGSG